MSVKTFFEDLFNFKKPQEILPAEPKERPRSLMSTHNNSFLELKNRVTESLQQIRVEGFKPFLSAQPKGVAMDNNINIKSQSQGGNAIPPQQTYWYASQSFIGFQLCAMISQHWLVKKICLMPAQDAVRNGYEITINDGTEVDPKIIDEIRKLDVKYRINRNLIEFVDQGRVFGIRIAMFIIDSPDQDYYFKPFNPDGITPGSYKGITQIDPYWVSPQLDTEAAGAPASIHFYEPTWWNVSGKLIHRTHLIIFKTEEVPDILKPAYIYAGVSIPQKIYERVYAAERTANEAPLLALTKRVDVIKCDQGQALADQPGFTKRWLDFVYNRDNYGVKSIALEDEYQQFDTSLADLDAVIMTQYQICAAIGDVPAVKVMGTSPKGFNSTGTYEEASYHEKLKSSQICDLTPFLERHHLIVIRSEICPKFNIAPFNTTVMWNALDEVTAKEAADINLVKAQTGSILSQSGAIDGYDERTRIIADPESGYTGLVAEEVPDIQDDGDDESEPANPGGKLF